MRRPPLPRISPNGSPRSFPAVLAVYLFGSVAEGRAGLHSDPDLAVVPASPAARGRRLDLLAALVAAGVDVRFRQYKVEQ